MYMSIMFAGVPPAVVRHKLDATYSPPKSSVPNVRVENVPMIALPAPPHGADPSGSVRMITFDVAPGVITISFVITNPIYGDIAMNVSVLVEIFENNPVTPLNVSNWLPTVVIGLYLFDVEPVKSYPNVPDGKTPVVSAFDPNVTIDAERALSHVVPLNRPPSDHVPINVVGLANASAGV